MSDISVIGLGSMGSALARSLVKGGHDVTVWNRTRAKARPLMDMGTKCAASAAAAVEASPVALICVATYQATRAMFGSAEVIAKLPGRTIVQLSTGTPKDAREDEAWFAAHNAAYLDGAILAGPGTIGTPRATILYSGRRDVFDRCVALLLSLGNDARFVGETVGAAAALDLAWLASLYGTFAGTAHGAVLCESEGVGLDLYSAVFAQSDYARWFIDAVRNDAFANPGAKLSVWNEALRQIRQQAGDAGISSDVPDFVAGILERGEAAGHGHEHIAAMVKVLRGAFRPES
jgi:3-hydroxyisobutyrate dehydrogenase-like beta-hydroxyacid dehydrogenase